MLRLRRAVLASAAMGGADAPVYLLRDEFTTDASAPLTSPRTCEPGPGTLTIVDGSNIMSVTSGTLLFSGNAGAPTRAEGGALARQAGRTLLVRQPRHVGIGWCMSGWAAAAGQSSPSEQRFFWGNATILRVSDTSGNISDLLTVATNTTPIDMAIVARSTGALFIASVNGGAWNLLWVSNAGNAATLYPSLAIGNVSAGIDMSYEFLRVFDLPSSWTDDYGIATQRLAGARSSGDTFTHEANALIEATVATLPSDGQIELRFRVQDATNYWQVTVDATGALDLDEVVDGSVTQRGTSAGVIVNGDRIVIIADGTTIKVFEANTLRITYTSAANFATETDGELETEGTGGAVTDIVAWPRTLSGAALSTLQRYTE